MVKVTWMLIISFFYAQRPMHMYGAKISMYCYVYFAWDGGDDNFFNCLAIVHVCVPYSTYMYMYIQYCRMAHKLPESTGLVP